MFPSFNGNSKISRRCIFFSTNKFSFIGKRKQRFGCHGIFVKKEKKRRRRYKQENGRGVYDARTTIYLCSFWQTRWYFTLNQQVYSIRKRERTSHESMMMRKELCVGWGCYRVAYCLLWLTPAEKEYPTNKRSPR